MPMDVLIYVHAEWSQLSTRPWNIFCKLPYVVSSRIVVCNNDNSSIFTSSQSHAKFLAIFPDHLGEVT